MDEKKEVKTLEEKYKAELVDDCKALGQSFLAMAKENNIANVPLYITVEEVLWHVLGRMTDKEKMLLNAVRANRGYKH